MIYERYRDVLFNIGFSWPAFSSLVERISSEIANLKISRFSPTSSPGGSDVDGENDLSTLVDGEVEWSEQNGCNLM